MTQTKDRTDTESVEEVVGDYQPPCSLVFTIKRGSATQQVEQCAHPAEWVGFLPCCGKSVLVCHLHHTKPYMLPFMCADCKALFDDLINWSRL